MRIVYRISEEDFMEGQRLFVSAEKWFRRLSRRLMPWEAAFCLIVGVTALVVTKDRVVPTFLCLISIYLFYRGFALRRYFRRRYRTDQRYKHDLIADISEHCIHFETAFVDSQMKWASVVRWLESDKIFMLFHAPMIFTIIPKRAFAAGDADAFRELVKRAQEMREP
jgi:YcxB-like protein